jgi:hypothetical protein
MARTRVSASETRPAKAIPQMPHTPYLISGTRKKVVPARKNWVRSRNRGIFNWSAYQPKENLNSRKHNKAHAVNSLLYARFKNALVAVPQTDKSCS